MSRLGGTAVLCSICAWLLAGLPQAVAAKPAGLPPERAAVLIAAIIQRDAHERLSQSRTAVTVAKGCCGQQVLRVHYRAPTGGDVKKDAYVLSVDTQRGVLRGVAISEAAREAGYKAETGSWKSERRRRFEIHSESRGADRAWEYSVSSSEVSQVARGRGGGGSVGLGSSRECELPRAVPAALYGEVLAMLNNASRHVSSVALPLSPC